MSRRSGSCVRSCLVIFAVVSALCVCGPALYWRFNKSVRLGDSATSCAPCVCDCPPPLSLLKIAPAVYFIYTTMLQTQIKSVTNPQTQCIFPERCNDSTDSFASFRKDAVGLVNLSVTDCGSNDPDMKKEMEMQFVDLLSEELKLQEAVSGEHARHMNGTLLEAKRVASQYQNEAEKCNSATEICEGAREHSEALLTKERKVTAMWERRARQMGWEGE